MRLLARLVVIVVLVAVFAFGVFFTLQNEALVPLDLLFIQFDPQWLALWVLLAFAMGGLVGLFVGMSAVMRFKRSELSAKRKLGVASKELDQLRTAGVKG